MEQKFIVTDTHTAIHLGSGNLPVLGTPALVAMLENVAMNVAKPLLEAEYTTVGAHIAINHLRPTPVGDTIVATATLTAQENRKLTFSLTASDSRGEVAKGTHVRFIVSQQKFMSKL